VLLRALNLYGDPSPWSPQGDGLRTALSFLNTTKYPPSLLFLLMTLGPAVLALYLIERATGADGHSLSKSSLHRALQPVLVFGRVPLFYFLLHVLIIHGLAVGASTVRFHAVHWMFESLTPDRFPITQPSGWPASLPLVYLAWAVVVLLAYPCCRWYGGVKARHPGGWTSYL
jgi:hypothetical protein